MATTTLPPAEALLDGQEAPVGGKHVPLKSQLKRVAQAMYTQSLALVEVNRTLRILRAIDLLTLESNRNMQQLCTDISRTIVDASTYDMVAILSLNDLSEKSLYFQGWALEPTLSRAALGVDVPSALFGIKIPLDSQWVDSKKVNLIIDFDQANALYSGSSTEDINKVLAVIGDSFKLRSVYVSKLKTRGSLTGLMIVGFGNSLPHLDDIELIERLGEPTGIALFNRLLFEQNQVVLKQLKQTNDKLQEVDEIKDEFISMASHQLRTPLTSMKGYVSMVLDGDTGPITDPQRGMLQQALNSSQRMVYLISDLLNVSRLRTGKFIINAKPTDLPSLVEAELSQLTETATARGIKFIFEKPDSFPVVVLDETKTRQVIMNFLDNALYYTPKGGEITVVLRSDDKTIEYLVIDTGVGVPKNEQYNLFTKFYRAQNARKMRPDGTGLGLYMARKIIVAQGGSIIFKSIEGQGSTFGFSFPRSIVEAQ